MKACKGARQFDDTLLSIVTPYIAKIAVFRNSPFLTKSGEVRVKRWTRYEGIFLMSAIKSR
ncbi:hypothetical protein JCM19239_1455 [Vibrio variabilis]|uniref:Uncharacterized protein n=1 Tax=Vibrio variabilis TaxID=990271 RepID=A0ABQ0JG44_9VIBR|nr:hypothetical protein JCM19239_1455 [Vibrio variabilis]